MNPEQGPAEPLRGPASSADAVEHRSGRAAPPGVPEGLVRWAAISWRFIVVVAAILLAAVLLRELQLVVVPILLALALATVVVPPTRWLRQRGFPPAVATATVFGGIFAALAGLVWLFAARLRAEFADLGDDLERSWDELQDWLVEGPLGLDPEAVEDFVEQGSGLLSDNASAIGSQAAVGARLVFEVLAAVVLALVLTFFLVKDADRIGDWAADRLPSDRQRAARAAALRAWGTTSAYLRGTAIVGLVDATFIGIGLWAIGVPLVVPLAIITFFAAFFPIVGATVAGLLAAAVAFVTGGVGDMVLVLILVIAVQQTESNVLAPVVMAKALNLHAVVILLALTAGAVVAGLLGALLAVPLTAVAVATHDEWRRQLTDRGPPGDDTTGSGSGSGGDDGVPGGDVPPLETLPGVAALVATLDERHADPGTTPEADPGQPPQEPDTDDDAPLGE
ncbi:MAG: AI-2E family transporter [Acidimicrobiia bacterium]|nr:AI-2E family transporter [Acidimicrobiia bacterium]